jgi:RNA recognition motif-containing protein
MNIYVSNLSYDTTTESLQELFAEYGEISSTNIIKDRDSGRSRGFGFVEMPNDTNAQKAIDELNNSDFEGKTITVNMARPKTERNDGGYNRRRY